MTGPVSPNQLVVAIEKDISNLYVRSLRHVHVYGVFQPPVHSQHLHHKQCDAPCWSKQSVKSPVDNPESRAIFPSQSIPNSLIAASSLCPAIFRDFSLNFNDWLVRYLCSSFIHNFSIHNDFTLKNPWLDVCSTILLKPFQAHLSSRLFLCEKNECETQYRHLARFSSPF